jgi:hypothetical protein
MNNIVVFTLKGCGHCVELKKELIACEIPHNEIEINSCLDEEEINAAIPGCSGGEEGGGGEGGGEGGGPFEKCCGIVFGCIPVPIGTCSQIGGTVVDDCASECNPTTLPPDFILCCVDSDGPYGGSGLCQAQHISWACSDIVTSCAQCSGSGGSGIVIIRYAQTLTPPTSVTGNVQVGYAGGYQIYTWTSSGTVTF